MPRVIGMRWGRKSTATIPGLALGSRPSRSGDPGQLLLDLGDVAVAADAVRLHALVDLAEHQVRLGLATGARDAALGVDHEVADQPGARERRQGEQGRGRVAAGRADDRDRRVDQRLELGAMELRQPVDRVVEEVGPRMLEAVPARVVGRVAEAEVGAEVDDRGAGGDEVGGDLRPGAVGECQEDTAIRRGGMLRRRIVEVSAWRRCGWTPVDGVVVAVPADQPDQFDVRVPGEQPDQLATDIPGRPDDPDADPARPACRVHDLARSGGDARRHGCDSDRLDGSHRRMTIQARMHSHATP